MSHDNELDLSQMREDEPPDVVDAAFGRFRKRLVLGGLILTLLVGSVAFMTGRSQSDEETLEDMVGQDHGAFHLIAQQLVGGEEWKVYAFLDQDGRPCMIETLGGGSCHAHAGDIKGEIADYGTSGTSWSNDDGSGAEYVVVSGAVPPEIDSVLIEFDDGTVERVATEQPPGFDDRVFALLSEGSIERIVVDVRAVR
jgi:hypothetical protein